MLVSPNLDISNGIVFDYNQLLNIQHPWLALYKKCISRAPVFFNFMFFKKIYIFFLKIFSFFFYFGAFFRNFLRLFTFSYAYLILVWLIKAFETNEGLPSGEWWAVGGGDWGWVAYYFILFLTLFEPIFSYFGAK